MEKTLAAPETLVEAVRFFVDPDVCLSFLAGLRWPDGNVACPTCGSQQKLRRKRKLRRQRKPG